LKRVLAGGRLGVGPEEQPQAVAAQEENRQTPALAVP
jgi:hypothetical protein